MIVNASNATIEAVYRAGGAKSVKVPKPAKPADFHPYEETKSEAARARRRGGVPLTKDNWHILKALAGKTGLVERTI